MLSPASRVYDIPLKIKQGLFGPSWCCGLVEQHKRMETFTAPFAVLTHTLEDLLRSREETGRTVQQDCRRATRDAEGYSGIGEEGRGRESKGVCPGAQPRRGQCPSHRRSLERSATKLGRLWGGVKDGARAEWGT